MKPVAKKIIITLVSLIIAFIIAFGVLIAFDPFGFSGEDIAIIQQTTINVESGEVSVNDQKVSNSLALYEGDTVEVMSSGFASITFFDDSVTRINGGENGTKLKLEVLDSENYDAGESLILVNLENGEIWSKVPKQTSPDITFKVKTVSVNATIRGSALNVSTDGKGKSEVMATEHSTKVSVTNPVTGEVLEETIIIEGQKAKIGYIQDEGGSKEDVDKIVNNFIIESIEIVDKLQAWFKMNTKKDEAFKIALKKKINDLRKIKVGALPGSFGYSIKNLQDGFKLLMAGNSRNELELKIAERKLIEADILFIQGDKEGASRQMQDAGDIIKKVATTEGKNINKAIQTSKKLLRETLPNEGDYEVKTFIANLEEDIAPEKKKDEVKEYNLNKMIIDLYDYSKSDDKKGASFELEKFKVELINIYNNNPTDPLVISAINNPYLELSIRNIFEGENEGKDLLNEFFGDEIENIEGFGDLFPEQEEHGGSGNGGSDLGNEDENGDDSDSGDGSDSIPPVINTTLTPPAPTPPVIPTPIPPTPPLVVPTPPEPETKPPVVENPPSEEPVITIPVSPEASR